MLCGFFDNMYFFKWHGGRWRWWFIVLILIDNELIRLSMMPPLLLHLNSWLPLRVLFESTLIGPPLLGLGLIIKLRLVPINPLKLFSILLCQALEHVLLSFVNNFTNSFPWTLVTTVTQPCILSLLQAVGPLIVHTHKTFKVKGGCMALIKSILLKDGVRWHRRVPCKL